MKPIRPRRAPACTEKRKARFIQRDRPEAGVEPARENYWIFLPRNRIICQVENSLYLDRGSLMNASSTELHRKIRRAAGRVWKPCNPLKSHKTTKELFGKAWTKTAWIWKSLQESLEVCLYFAAFASTRGSAWSTSAIACSRGGSGRKWRFRKLQKKAPNALKSLDARLKSALRPAARDRPSLRAKRSRPDQATVGDPSTSISWIDSYHLASAILHFHV